MTELYRYLKSSLALTLSKKIQDIYWDKIGPIREENDSLAFKTIMQQGTYIRSVIKTNDSEKFDFIDELQEEFPFLSKHMFVFDLPPQFITPIHMDSGPPERERINGKRLLSMNIPIHGCADGKCSTEFFNIDPKFLVYVKEASITGVIPGAPKEIIDHYVLKDCPILVNTQIPHRVNNSNNTENRTSVSWTIKDSWSWEEVINYLEP